VNLGDHLLIRESRCKRILGLLGSRELNRVRIGSSVDHHRWNYGCVSDSGVQDESREQIESGEWGGGKWKTRKTNLSVFIRTSFFLLPISPIVPPSDHSESRASAHIWWVSIPSTTAVPLTLQWFTLAPIVSPKVDCLVHPSAPISYTSKTLLSTYWVDVAPPIEIRIPWLLVPRFGT